MLPKQNDYNLLWDVVFYLQEFMFQPGLDRRTNPGHAAAAVLKRKSWQGWDFHQSGP